MHHGLFKPFPGHAYIIVCSDLRWRTCEQSEYVVRSPVICILASPIG